MAPPFLSASVSAASIRQMRLVCAVLVGLVWIVFGQTLQYEYVDYDDDIYVYTNKEVQKGLTTAGIVKAFTQREAGLWNPLVTFSHMVDCQIYGLPAGGHHLTNLLLHLASVLILFHVLHKMTGSVWPSAFVAALFAIHPLRVESVAWIAERKDVLSGLFFMLTLWAYLHYLKKPGSLYRYSTVVLAFALGLMTKPMLVTLPFVLLLLDYWPLNRLFRTSSPGTAIHWPVIKEKIPLFILSFTLVLSILMAPEGPEFHEPTPLATRLAESPEAFVTYLGQIFWPADLVLIYPHSPAKASWWPLWLTLVLVLTVAGFLFRKKYPWLWTGWLWNMGMLVPVCGIIQVSRHWQADHYTYLPQIGIYIAIAWGVTDLTVSWKHRTLLLGIASCLVLTAFALTARRQCAYWKNGETIWRHTISRTNDNFIAESNLGTVLLNHGRLDEALPYFQTALRLHPRDFIALKNTGHIHLQKGEAEDAVQCYEGVLKLNPKDTSFLNDYSWALATHTDARFRNGKRALELALKLCTTPGKYDPNFLDTLAAAYAELGDFPQAIALVETAIQKNTSEEGLQKLFRQHLESYRLKKPWRDEQLLPPDRRPKK